MKISQNNIFLIWLESRTNRLLVSWEILSQGVQSLVDQRTVRGWIDEAERQERWVNASQGVQSLVDQRTVGGWIDEAERQER